MADDQAEQQPDDRNPDRHQEVQDFQQNFPGQILPNRRKANVNGLVISSIKLMITNGAKGLKKCLKCF